MKNWFNNLPLYYKVAFVSSIFVLIGFLALVFGYFVSQMGLPNGLIIGGGVGTLSYFLIGKMENFDNQKNKPIIAIVVTITRYLVIGGLIALALVLEYKMGINAINVFTLVGGYFIPLIIYLIFYLLERKNV